MNINTTNTVPAPLSWRWQQTRHPQTRMSLIQYQDLIRHDLEQLLNCKQLPHHDKRTASKVTLYDYGLALDPRDLIRSNAAERHLTLAIQSAIKAHEPRLSETQVFIDDKQDQTPLITLHIVADLTLFPQLPSICYPSCINGATHVTTLSPGYSL